MEQDLAPARPLCSTTGLTFLSLPHHVRESIYAYLSLSPDLIDLNYTNLKVYPKGAYPETLRCRRLGPYEPYILKKVETATTEEAWELGSETEEGEEETYGEPCLGRAWGVQQSMLLVSKQVHGEVEAWIYANSVIRVCPGQPLGLSRFMSMSENAIAHMGALTIRLDKSTDAVYQNKWDNCPELPQRIDLSCAWGREVLCKWREVIEKLCRSVKPGQLRLRVVLAAKTMANAETLLDPMMALPLLKDCGICLNMDGPPTWWKIHTQLAYLPGFRATRYLTADTEASKLVQDLVTKLTPPRLKEQKPFKYLELPRELRLTIMDFTTLRSDTPVQWRPRMTFNITANMEHRRYSNRSGVIDYTAIKSPASTSNQDDIMSMCCKNCCPADLSDICYCSVHGRVWSSSCTCQYRHPLFLVSKQVRGETMKYYYSRNHFLITHFRSPRFRNVGWRWRDRRAPPAFSNLPEIELSLYIDSITDLALRNIRQLEWVLPSSRDAHLLPGTVAWQKYLNTIVRMRDGMDMSALTFTINLSGFSHPQVDTVNETLEGHKAIFAPFKLLFEAGMKDFFVHASSQMDESERFMYEQRLERTVMSEEYDSAKRGKPAEWTSAMIAAAETVKM